MAQAYSGGNRFGGGLPSSISAWAGAFALLRVNRRRMASVSRFIPTAKHRHTPASRRIAADEPVDGPYRHQLQIQVASSLPVSGR